MLLLGTTITVDGITIYPDHADPNQFWYLPGPSPWPSGTTVNCPSRSSGTARRPSSAASKAVGS